jgi:hypothetical protein
MPLVEQMPLWGQMIQLGRKIYAIGGADRSRILSAVEEYDPSTDTWKQMPNIPTARAGLTVNAVNGKIYAFGGFGGMGGPSLSTVEEFDTGLENQSIDFKGKLPTTWGEMRTAMNR